MTKRSLVALVVLLACCSVARASGPVTIAPDRATMEFDDLGLYGVRYTLDSGRTESMPDGWTGFFVEPSGICCTGYGMHRGKQAFLLHSPWRNGVGVVQQRFRIALPRVRGIVLSGSTAMRASDGDKSDGARFRVLVNDTPMLDRLQTSGDWSPYVLDLTRFAGRIVDIVFENDPGPARDAGFDFSLWGERRLRLEGFVARPARLVVPPGLDLARLARPGQSSVVPSVGYSYTNRSPATKARPSLQYLGADGRIEYSVQAPRGDRDPPTGIWSCKATSSTGGSVSVPVGRIARIQWLSEAHFDAAKVEASKGTIRVIARYTLGGRTTVVTTVATAAGKSLRLRVTCSQPLAASIDIGGWGPVLRRRHIAVPYLPQSVDYLPTEGVFVGAFLDWTESSASSHDGTTASYGPLTDGRRHRISETAIYTLAWHLAEAFPNIPNPPSPYLREVGGRIVLDIWGGNYRDIASDLERLHAAGIRNCIALIHVWQRSGYDNALPDHLPANADLGGDDGMKVLVGTACRLGYRIALHENYVDYYTNYDRFSPDDIALDSKGGRQLAWYNAGTKMQSFAVKPGAILRLAATQSPEIHRRYGTNANYLDVHSAVPPWFHVDMDARQPGSGRFATVWDVHRKLWDYERRVHRGPVFGEGNNHAYWSGLLDGVEAQFGIGWGYNSGMNAPLLVDFDLLKVHPLQINHGMGYYERWWAQPNWSALPPAVVLDQYRMQEVAYGHAGFLAGSTWNVLPLAWLEHGLMTPVTSRQAGSRVTAISYWANGKWIDGSAASQIGQWDRVRVRYSNGLVVWANNAPDAWIVAGRTIPRYGWAASGPDIAAGTTMQGKAIVDSVDTPSFVLANARRRRDWDLTGVVAVRPRVGSFSQSAPRRFVAEYRWGVQAAPGRDYGCFVHFGNPGRDAGDEGIRFQGDHMPATPSSTWTAGQTVADGPYEVTIPDSVPDGTYQWTIGLITPGSGARAGLLGPVDTRGRILLGVITVREGAISFTPESSSGTDRLALYGQHLNDGSRALRIGPVITNGGVAVRRDGSSWVLNPLPGAGPMDVRLDSSRFGTPAVIASPGGTSTTVRAVRLGKWWSLPMNGAREYRWPASR